MYEAEERQWWYSGQRSIALALLASAGAARSAGAPAPRLLDAGCGTGYNLVALGRLARATGVDLSPEAIAFCRARGVAALRGSVLQLPFADASFDVVTSFDVLYHAWVSDDRAAVAEAARVLRPGGVLLVRVPALRALWGAHDVEVQSRHRYTRPELVALLEGCGLRVQRASYCNSILFPLLFARRTLDRALGREGSDVGFLPAPLEWAFGARCAPRRRSCGGASRSRSGRVSSRSPRSRERPAAPPGSAARDERVVERREEQRVQPLDVLVEHPGDGRREAAARRRAQLDVVGHRRAPLDARVAEARGGRQEAQRLRVQRPLVA